MSIASEKPISKLGWAGRRRGQSPATGKAQAQNRASASPSRTLIEPEEGLAVRGLQEAALP